MSDFNTSVRLGIVMATDNEKRLARVKFTDVEMISDWLPVLMNQPYIPSYDGVQRTEYKEGGSDFALFERHYHELTILPWMPKVNDQVLVIYLPAKDADGFILGGVKPWQ